MIMNISLEKKVKRNNSMKNSRRQNRIRYKLKKVTDRKRLSIFKSNNQFLIHVIINMNDISWLLNIYLFNNFIF